MHRFTNILFCPLGDDDNPALARRVIDLAARNNANVTFFGVVHEPSRLERAFHSGPYIDAILEAERKEVSAKLAECAPTSGLVPTDSRITVGSAALSIIERVLVADHDLVVVTSDEDKEDHATIKRLLRKCPCPVWVIRPTRARTQRVLAAVNPDPSELELNRTILELASSMVALYGGELHVVHAWELYGEATMRSSAFIHTAQEEIDALLASEESSHRQALDVLLTESGLESQPWEKHLYKGPPADIVREAVTKYGINLLVMGTVARTGVAGLIMGNTAEAVLDRVRCSVIATKPPGFVSPVDLGSRES
ncbi:MAG: universal stress protein [Acidimicrobiales bacterium]|nr:universal stress protein [Acidimicrobiales bacterium]